MAIVLRVHVVVVGRRRDSTNDDTAELGKGGEEASLSRPEPFLGRVASIIKSKVYRCFAATTLQLCTVALPSECFNFADYDDDIHL